VPRSGKTFLELLVPKFEKRQTKRQSEVLNRM
jgi:hypothetical protein